MTEQEFQNLLKKAESDTLDFKRDHYDFSGVDADEKDRRRGKFLKDILCMKNTPRSESAFIVIGIKRNPNGTTELVGIDQSVDDAELQKMFQNWIFPHPLFRYEQVAFQGMQFGIIEIPSDRSIGPCFSLKDIPGAGIKAKVLYYRRNSQNAEVDFEQQKAIFRWFDRSAEIGIAQQGDDSPWDQFVRAVDGFTPEKRYVLAISKLGDGQTTEIENLGLVDWLFVGDFDPASESRGVLQQARKVIESHRSLHRLTKGNEVAFNPSKATYWYFARGIEGRESTLALGRWNDWHRSYERDLRDKLSHIAGISPAPVNVVVVWNDEQLLRHLNTVLEAAISCFGDSATITIVTEKSDAYASLASAFNAALIEMPLDQFLQGLGHLKGEQYLADGHSILLPSSSGADVEVNARDFSWVEEEIEIVHKRIGLRSTSDAPPGTGFLQGREISWFELGLRLDVERDISDRLKGAIRNDLERRRTSRINLFHAPGSGGSTLARRVMWDFRNDFPTLILKRTQPRETIERIARIFALTGKPVLIQVEGSEITESQGEEVYGLLASRNIPAVLFQVLRRFRQPQQRERTFYLDSVLSGPEGTRFLYALSREVPARKGALDTALKSSRSEERTPFFLGLVAFERDFVSLQPYVANHLLALQEIPKRILTFLALAHYYAQQPLSEQAFADLLNLPHNKVVHLRNALSSAGLGLLVEISKGFWRTVHYLIAEEIIQQVLSSPSNERRLWKDRLADWAITFSDFCHSSLPEQSQQNLEVVRRVFVYRDDSEMLGTEKAGERLYSQLIADIRVQEGQLRVLLHLTDLFPAEAHFWAHLGRFYSNEMKETDKAIDAIDKALSFKPDDHVLHHMKGMALRSSVYNLIHENAELEVIVGKGKLAAECFRQARLLNPVDDHGYISEAQMITRILDYCGKQANAEALVTASKHNDPWLRESFQAAEDLLMEVRLHRQGERPSEYEERCRAELDVLYGQHGRALEIWQNLLDRRDSSGKLEAYGPPIRRQIVWTHLARNQRRWENLAPKVLERSVSLLEQNLTEEPNDDRNIRLWIQAIRSLTNPPTIENVIERVVYWRTNSNSLDAAYYLYVLHALIAVNGSTLAVEKAERALDECRFKSRFRRDRTRSFEWIGKNTGLNQLVHQDRLGDWNQQEMFWANPNLLMRVTGLIARISGDGGQAGEIEIKGGLKAFFVPGRSGHSIGRSENQAVSFFLGFSYDGPRAWSVENA